tara:strand:+ start:794 stop:964 length:171 start_codon:yes stop_codon:yes gene_type:complete
VAIAFHWLSVAEYGKREERQQSTVDSPIATGMFDDRILDWQDFADYSRLLRSLKSL